MNLNQIKYIVEEELKDELDKITPLMDAFVITLEDYENKFLNVDYMRVKFDTTNEILEVYHCRKYNDQIPSNWIYGKNYDTINGINYKYLCDENGEPIVDYYDFEAIRYITRKGGMFV